MKSLTVDLQDHSYPIYIGHGLLGDGDRLKDILPGNQVFLVSNETVSPLYAKTLLESLDPLETAQLNLPDGERFKDLHHWSLILDSLADAGMHRDATVVSLGGGVVSDIAGFAAACYQRGIGHVIYPTTLLAQVDAAIGGKTAINFSGGKNMIGAFHQPLAVISDTTTLRTLDDRQMRAGVAEIIKSALIADDAFFAWLEQHADKVLKRDDEALCHAIEVCCRIKSRIVSADEREKGERALLNLGHSFAHAIEAASDYRYLHGEAVAVGLLLAADLSERLGLAPGDLPRRIRALLEICGLPTGVSGLEAADIARLMNMDKKVSSGKLKLVLLKKAGQAVLIDEFDPALPEAVIREYCD